jgi:hypothetical protein
MDEAHTPYDPRYYPYPLERRPTRYQHGHGWRSPLYLAVAERTGPPVPTHGPVCRNWPVLTPDGGIRFCSTEEDAFRIATDMNAMLDHIDVLQGWIATLYRHLPEHERGNFPALQTLLADAEPASVPPKPGDTLWATVGGKECLVQVLREKEGPHEKT